MSPPTLLVVVLAVLVGSNPCFAKKRKQADPQQEYTIVEASPMSVTVDLGDSNDQTWTISGNTKITLEGSAVTADDLKAGMVATVSLASDNKTAVEIDAKKPPRVVKQGKKLGTTVFWW